MNICASPVNTLENIFSISLLATFCKVVSTSMSLLVCLIIG